MTYNLEPCKIMYTLNDMTLPRAIGEAKEIVKTKYKEKYP